jgi:polysaccharide transporter, PST family
MECGMNEAPPNLPPVDGAEPLLGRAELTDRTSAGVFLIASRGAAILVLGFGGTVALARLLNPSDFGIIAIGISVTLIGGLLADGGLGAGLIRRERPPDKEELASLTALQLGVTLICLAATAAIALPVAGEAGLAITVMAASMPITVLQFPSRILLERGLFYRPMAAVEVSQVFLFNVVAIALVAAGLGVEGVAIAMVGRAAVGAVLMIRVGPIGFPAPRFSWERIRPLMSFGVRFQAINGAWILREQLLNAVFVAIAGVSVLGLWRLVTRLMQVPELLLQSLWRVSFPAMSQWVALRHEVVPVIARSSGIAAVGVATVMTALAASAPGLVPSVFGESWREAATALPPACLGLAISGSVSVATQGYLYAMGDASTVMRSVILQALIWLAVTAALLPLVGIAAGGIGWLVSSVAEAMVLGRAVHERTGLNLLGVLSVPLSVATVAGAAGWLFATSAGATLASGIAGGLIAVALLHTGLLLMSRPLALDSYRFVVRATRAAKRGVGAAL